LGENNLISRRIQDPLIEQFLGRESVEAIAALSQSRIEGFYRQVAATQGQEKPTYFAEKLTTDPFVPALIEELYPSGREIILVRDLRDLVCSVFSYNAKRQRVAFGRQYASDDKSYIQRLRQDALDLLRNWKSRAAQTFLLRYEDLVLRPDEVIESILEYLGLDLDAATIQRMLRGAQESKIDAQRQHQTSSDPVSSIGRWRRDMDHSLCSACSESFDDILSEFGYEVRPL
jgi:sulfotransferase family protein